MENKRVNSIIEALAKHEDVQSVNVLERVGTNCENDDVRRLTAKALIKKNNQDSLAVVISSKGKGINDLSTSVAMSTINELLQLKDKEEAISVLENTENNHEDDEVRETARSVKALMSFS
ncbi:MAG TPA: HEAT repeat domain-containing protein [Candidatus Gastranaerophilaceae bacterium]|nr:HEAT repeat domain-containing protein [Candidatus Gastranaerophilaceae bacterium]HPT40964.1 HEAT repeat domain-containing protein [Candidatus Gastranaerophilaceae bacterium]